MACRHDIARYKIRKFQINEVALWVSSEVFFINKNRKFWIPDENGKDLGLRGTCNLNKSLNKILKFQRIILH
jgi:hypothetical protein